MTNVTTALPTFASAPTRAPVENELGAGIEGSYAIMKFKGKVWTTQFKKEETPLMRPDGDGPRASIDVVIVRSAKVKSKSFYPGGYVEGSNQRPACQSSNGVTPDAGVPAKQSAVCDTCPQNQWGAAPPRQDGTPSKGKACRDVKRIAIVPANVDVESPDTLNNTMLGGPMLLRIPASSLGAAQTYGDRLAKKGYHTHEVITRISFDTQEAYPKLVFEPKRILTDAEKAVAAELHTSAQAKRVVEDAGSTEYDADDQSFQFSSPLPTAPAASNVVPLAKPAPVVTPQVTAAPAPQPIQAAGQPVESVPLDLDLEKQLDALLSK